MMLHCAIRSARNRRRFWHRRISLPECGA